MNQKSESIVFKKEVLLIIAAMKRFLEFVGNANRGWFFGIVIAQQIKKTETRNYK